MSGDNNTKELPIVSEFYGREIGSLTIEAITRVSRRDAASIRLVLVAHGIEPVARLATFTEGDGLLYLVRDVHAAYHKSGLQLVIPPSGDDMCRTFDLGGGRVATVRRATGKQLKHIFEKTGVAPSQRKPGDNGLFGYACASWGIVSVTPAFTGGGVHEKNGEFWSDEFMNLIHPSLVDEIASYVITYP